VSHPHQTARDGEFEAHSEIDGERFTLHLEGNADLRAKDRLAEFLGAADDEAVAAAFPEVFADLRALQFMNSSCLKTLVAWIGKVQNRPAPQRYLIRFLREPAALWQTRSLTVLATLAPEIVQLE
jgi:hypothetical protein